MKFISSLIMFFNILCFIWRTLAILCKLLGFSILNDKMGLLLLIIINLMGSGKIGYYLNNYEMFYKVVGQRKQAFFIKIEQVI